MFLLAAFQGLLNLNSGAVSTHVRNIDSSSPISSLIRRGFAAQDPGTLNRHRWRWKKSDR
ncbi:hypothetical protein M758_UG180900 [Ceratodon purpureus]|nr:hypothetical protein M758_UG180900 [Ceratodon purpureus]